MKNNARVAITPKGKKLLKAIEKKRHHKWPTTKAKRFYMIDARRLKPLADQTRPIHGLQYLKDCAGVVCLSCGARHAQPLLMKHKPKCSYPAFWRAFQALKAAIEGRGK